MADVDQVFTNAMAFNEEGSEIWNHASILMVSIQLAKLNIPLMKRLQNYFRQLMSDLPAKYNMSGDGASSETLPNKIKLKIPGHHNVTHAETSAETGEGGATIRLRVPAKNTDAATHAATQSSQTTAPTPAAASNGIDTTPTDKVKVKPSPAPTPQLPPAPLPAPTPKPAKAIPSHLRSALADQQQPSIATPAPTLPSASNYQHTPNAQLPQSIFYTPSLPSTSNAATATPSRASATPAPLPTSSTLAARAGAPSPKPPIRAAGIYSVRLEVTPSGRRLPLLDLSAGVRNWAVRLGENESGLVVKDVKFERLGEADDGSDEEREKDPSGVVSPPKKRGRGRPRKNPIADKPPEISSKDSLENMHDNMADPKKVGFMLPQAENVVVRLDGTLVASRAKSIAPDEDGTTEIPDGADGNKVANSKTLDEWTVDLPSGRHVLEVGRKGNSVLWQVYVYV